MTEEGQESDPFQSLIAEILNAEARGESVDREEMLRAHLQLERSLRDFFANHDSMKVGNGDEEIIGHLIYPPGRSKVTS